MKEKGLSSPFAVLGRKPRAAITVICECGGRSKEPAVKSGSQEGDKKGGRGGRAKKPTAPKSNWEKRSKTSSVEKIVAWISATASKTFTCT